MKKFNIIFKISCSLLFMILLANNSLAQLVGWGNKEMISIQENSNTLKLDYQVLITLNTQILIAANQMQLNGDDIRFSKDCNGTSLYNYFIESGINTASTKIWVMIDSLPANGNRIIHLFYGNAIAVAASNFNNTFPVASQLIVSAGTQALTGTNNYSWFEIKAGASVTIGPNSPFVINARMIRITGTLNGNGAGYLGGGTGTDGFGSGAGQVSSGNNGTFGAGGASYGGSGGNGGGAGATATPSNVGQPGAIYGTLNTDSIDMGSGGGGSASGGAGGAGGAGIILNGDVVDIPGIVSANGSNGVQAILNGAGGGGSGGGIKINGNDVAINGILRANGGNGQPGGYGSGGGGGGRIKVFSDASLVNTGTLYVVGGAAGSPNAETVPQTAGSAGTTFIGTYISEVPTFAFIPTPNVILTASSNPVCQGTPITFNATTGFSNYNFFINGISIQDSSINMYGSATPNNNDMVKVLATYASTCIDTSNLIIITVNPNDTINLTSSSGTNAQAVCVNTAIMDITYDVTGGGTGASVTGLPTGVTGSYAGGVFTINGTPTQTGTFNYTVTTTGTCAQATATGTITVNPNATGTDVITSCSPITWVDGNNYTASTTTPTFTVVGGSFQGCDSVVTLNLTINTFASGTDVITSCTPITWIDGNNYSVSTTTPIFTIAGGSANGCDSVVTLNLTINSFTSGTDVQTACNSYTWINGNNYTASTNTPTFTIVGGSAQGCDSVVTLNLTINTVDASTSTNTNTITANATGATFQWLDCDNSNAVIAGETNQSYTTTANGNYAVEVTQNGCTDTSSCVNMTGVGLEEYNKTIAAIYPNPTSGEFTINLKNASASGVGFTLTTLEGKVIKREQKAGNITMIIDLSEQPKGIYLLKIKDAQSVNVYKVIRQ